MCRCKNSSQWIFLTNTINITLYSSIILQKVIQLNMTIVMKTDLSIQTLVNNSATLLKVTIDGTQYKVHLDDVVTSKSVPSNPDTLFQQATALLGHEKKQTSVFFVRKEHINPRLLAPPVERVRKGRQL